MRILYVSQWLEPEPAFKGIDFALALAARGHEVEVATGFPNYPGGKLYPGFRLRPYLRDRLKGVPVHRLYLYPSHNTSALGRALNYVSFFISLLLFGLARGRRYDVIYVYHPPIMPALATALFAFVWRTPFVIDIQDLWPDSALASGMVPAWAGGLLARVCDFVYARAARIIAQSEGIAQMLRRRGVPASKVQVIYNWSTYAPGPQAVPRKVLPNEGIHCVYGGNLGQAQALETVLEAARQTACKVPGFHLHLFGNGIERAKLEALGAGLGADCIHFHGQMGRADMDRVFDEADMLVLHLRDDPLYTITVPSKLQHYLACGRPVIAGIAGEACGLLERAGAGLVSAPGDARAMATNMEALCALSDAERQAMGLRGRAFYRANMAFEAAIATTVMVIADAQRVKPKAGGA